MLNAMNICVGHDGAKMWPVFDLRVQRLLRPRNDVLGLFSINFFRAARCFRQKNGHLLCMHKNHTEYRFKL